MKLRMPNWYWGNYVTKPLKHTKRSCYEPYVEEKHGWHHSEEFKNGQLKPYPKATRGEDEIKKRGGTLGSR